MHRYWRLSSDGLMKLVFSVMIVDEVDVEVVVLVASSVPVATTSVSIVSSVVENWHVFWVVDA